LGVRTFDFNIIEQFQFSETMPKIAPSYQGAHKHMIVKAPCVSKNPPYSQRRQVNLRNACIEGFSSFPSALKRL